MRHRKLTILKSLVLGLAVAAVAAPTALGEPRGPGNPVTAAPVQQSLSPDDRSLYRGSAQLEPVIVSSSPDDRAFYRGVESPNAPVSIIVSSSSNDFRWTDASLGAGSTLAFILLLGAAALLIRHQ